MTEMKNEIPIAPNTRAIIEYALDLKDSFNPKDLRYENGRQVPLQLITKIYNAIGDVYLKKLTDSPKTYIFTETAKELGAAGLLDIIRDKWSEQRRNQWIETRARRQEDKVRKSNKEQANSVANALLEIAEGSLTGRRIRKVTIEKISIEFEE